MKHTGKIASVGVCVLFALSALLAGCDLEEVTAGWEDASPQGQPPVVSPLAVLDKVDVTQAFGDTEAEGWSFALDTDASGAVSYGFSLTSAGGNEVCNVELGAEISLADTFGIHSDKASSLGFGLFGGGTAGLGFTYRGPKSDAEPVEKKFEASIYHDGSALFCTFSDGTETETDLEAVASEVAKIAESRVFARLTDAATSLPEALSRGVGLRVGVENLIEFGFRAEIDDTDGIAVRLVAEKGLFTALLNDMLESFLPVEWLTYIPRADFSYTSTVFDIELAFDENGLFKKYSVKSDVALGLSLNVRPLFLCESEIASRGSYSLCAYRGELPAPPASEGGESAS